MNTATGESQPAEETAKMDRSWSGPTTCSVPEGNKVWSASAPKSSLCERDDRHSVVDDHGSCKATPGWRPRGIFALDCRLWEVSFV